MGLEPTTTTLATWYSTTELHPRLKYRLRLVANVFKRLAGKFSPEILPGLAIVHFDRDKRTNRLWEYTVNHRNCSAPRHLADYT